METQSPDEATFASAGVEAEYEDDEVKCDSEVDFGGDEAEDEVFASEEERAEFFNGSASFYSEVAPPSKKVKERDPWMIINRSS